MYQIYYTKNKLNNKYYIGIHKGDVYADSYYGSGVAISNAIKKYGKQNFEITVISEFVDKNLASYLEKLLVGKDTINDIYCYNIIGGGQYPKYKTMSQKSIQKMLSNRTYYKGQKAPFYNKCHTIETKRKISKSKKGFKHTKEAKTKISKAGIKDKVIQLSLDENILAEFKSVAEASKKLGKNRCNIYRCCNGKRNTAYGYKWRYKNDL